MVRLYIPFQRSEWIQAERRAIDHVRRLGIINDQRDDDDVGSRNRTVS